MEMSREGRNSKHVTGKAVTKGAAMWPRSPLPWALPAKLLHHQEAREQREKRDIFDYNILSYEKITLVTGGVGCGGEMTTSKRKAVRDFGYVLACFSPFPACSSESLTRDVDGSSCSSQPHTLWAHCALCCNGPFLRGPSVLPW